MLACFALLGSSSASNPADDSAQSAHAMTSLAFVVKNEYLSAPAAHTDGGVAAEATTEAVIEPHRPTFFTATGAAKDDDASNARKLGSHALKLKIKHVEMLIERGGSNAERMTSDVARMKRDLKLMTSKAEAELEGVSYVWGINGKEYRGRTVGEYRCLSRLILRCSVVAHSTHSNRPAPVPAGRHGGRGDGTGHAH